VTRHAIQRIAAEALGTALLVTIVVGSGIMAERLAQGNQGIALLGNTIATGAGLFVLIQMLGPISGAHLNPAVTMVSCLARERPWTELPPYAAAQFLGGMIGSAWAHAMFALPLLQTSAKVRDGAGQWIAEATATFGLVLTVRLVGNHRPAALPAAVALYITGAYWFTASTSFANPAVTLARSLTDSFAGIAPSSVLGFMLAQVTGALLGWLTARFFGKQ
jgi:glycerol uptake facilitator-like aquaporin